MALDFSSVAAATDELEIWSANERDFQLVISNQSCSGPGLRGQPGFVASWRPINLNRTAVKVGGSPFGTFAEAEKACEAMLVHLVNSVTDPRLKVSVFRSKAAAFEAATVAASGAVQAGSGVQLNVPDTLKSDEIPSEWITAIK